MDRSICVDFDCGDTDAFKLRLLNWMKGFQKAALLDGNREINHTGQHWEPCEWMAGIGAVAACTGDEYFLADFQKALDHEKAWWFGFIGYDIKNSIEKLHSRNPDPIPFPPAFFFIPELVVLCRNKRITLVLDEKSPAYPNVERCYRAICQTPMWEPVLPAPIRFSCSMKEKEYLEQFEKISRHILNGDVYELNYCLSFHAAQVKEDPLSLYALLNQATASSFSCYMRINDRYLIGASPERFLRKAGNRLFSQPMKGTASRAEGREEDELRKKELFENEKERAENVMIVDLVRNDLSALAQRGTVQVDELFGMYTLPRVHQMISTVSCTLAPNVNFREIIRRTFPMGSMTGAPKIRAMQLIEDYEKTRRGAFSGCAGYISPSGDFDLNVIIRSFLYDAQKQLLSISAGSAITAQSTAKQEYEECLLKAGYAISAIGADLREDPA